MDKRRILFIETGLTSGGSWHSLNGLIMNNRNIGFLIDIAVFIENDFTNSWREKGFNVYLLETNNFLSPQHLVSRILNKLLKITNKNTWKNIFFIFIYKLKYRLEIQSLSHILSTNQYSLIIANVNPERDLFAIISSIRYSAKSICFIRSNRTLYLNSKILKYLNENVNLFICNSNFTLKYWQQLGISVDKSIVIYNTFNLCSINSKTLNRIKDNHFIKDNYIVISIANFSDAKGHAFLIDAFNEVVKLTERIQLILVGEGPLFEPIQQKVKKINLEKRVHFLGYSNAAFELLSKADLLVVPSKNEAFGRVIVEGFSLKKPIIASNVGGIPELITHRKNGIMVNYGDISGLKDSILEIYNNKELGYKIANEGYQFYLSNFSNDTQLKIFIQNIKEIIDKK